MKNTFSNAVIFGLLLAPGFVPGLQTAQAQTRKPALRTVAAPRSAAVSAKVPASARRAVAPAPAPSAASASTATASSPAASNAAETFSVGTNAVNLGVGVGSRYGYGAGYSGGNSSVSPAFSVSYERGIVALGPGVVGVGGIVGYQGANYDYGSGSGKWSYSDVIVMLRGSFHYPLADNLDTYAGLGIGIRRLSSSYSGPVNPYYNLDASASATAATSGLFVGARYYFSSSIGAFAELGYDQTYLKVGLAAKL